MEKQMKCPFCAEEIKEDALKCRYCGEWIVKKSLFEEATGFLNDLKEKYEERKAEKFRSKINFPLEGNPLIMPGGVTIKTNSIKYKDRDYTYDLVIHVGFFWKKTYYNGIPSWSEIRLNLSMKGLGDLVTIAGNTPFALESRKAMDIYSAFLYVRHLSCPFRYKSYAEFINNNRYFEYDGTKFHVDGTIERKGIKYNIRNGQLLKSPFQLKFVMKPGKLFDKKIVINTHWDSDVFYELLKTLYGIAWS
jgi:hypothetical protein